MGVGVSSQSLTLLAEEAGGGGSVLFPTPAAWRCTRLLPPFYTLGGQGRGERRGQNVGSRPPTLLKGPDGRGVLTFSLFGPKNLLVLRKKVAC